MTFTKLNLHPKILQAIEVCGYTKPTPVQEQSIPHILNGKDLLASAQTGTGKTAAYVLPGLQLLLTKPPQNSMGKARILILAPTRELAGQITKVIGKYGKFIRPNVASFVGGVPYFKQLKEMSRPMDIIIATPGRLMDHMRSKGLDLSHIEMLIIDEADRMLDMGFINDIKTIVHTMPKTRQTLLFTATADDNLLSVIKNLLKEPVRINISQDKIDTNLIQHAIHVVADANSKNQLLRTFLDEENIYKAIIFSATKRDAARLTMKLRDLGHAASEMHGDLKQSARNRTLAQFRAGEVQFLVATDVAARGIDVIDISHVINYDLPRSAEDYVHRIGRTGRAGRTGIAVSMVLESEIRQVHNIERYIGEKLPRVYADGITDRCEQVQDNRRSSGRGRPGGGNRGGRSSGNSNYGRPAFGDSRPAFNNDRKPAASYGRPASGDSRPSGRSSFSDDRSSGRPATSYGRPAFGDNKPAFNNDRSFGKPAASYGRSASGDSRPSGRSSFNDDRSSGRPATSYGRPAFGDRQPSGRPSFGDNKPVFSDDRSAGRPATSYGRPAFNDRPSSGKPAGSYGRPAGKPFGKPATSYGRPAFGDSRPSGRPSFGDNKPAFNDDRSAGRPATSYGKPAFNDRPSSGKPAGSYGRPAFGDARPSSGRGKPAGTGYGKPAANRGKPSTGFGKPPRSAKPKRDS